VAKARHLAPAPLSVDTLTHERDRIAAWWLKHGPDEEHGGFVGLIDADGKARSGANKGIVLATRILWFFSTLALLDERTDWRQAAERAYASLRHGFHDAEHGGVFWELEANGTVVADKKQSYAQAFAIYACVAWHRASSNAEPLERAMQYFDRLERRVRDRKHGGYLEALSRSWGTLYDLRLGSADLNAPKSANTHLHLLEAYTELYRVSQSPLVEEALRHLVALFFDRIAVARRGPLGTFFDSRWNRLSELQSFGHEIEASWLLWEAVEALRDRRLSEHLLPLILGLAEACLEHGVGADGRLCEQRDPLGGKRSDASVWWVQAEALVGFLNTCRLTGEDRYRRAAETVWRHIQLHHVDAVGGEWFWWPPGEIGIAAPPYKAGFWKGPYHNGRAMIEAARLLVALESPL
jgi:mannobiose 2-epimerase